MDCIFCKIANKEIPATVVYEDEQALAFEDISPVSPMHVLVIPKKHIATTLEIEEEDEALMGHLYRVAAQIARDRGLAERGFRVVMNTNAEAGQAVFHCHLHVMGGHPMGWPPWPKA